MPVQRIRTHSNRRTPGAAPATAPAATVTAETVFRGLLAALAADGHSPLKAGQASFHRAFYRVIEEVKSGRVPLPVDLREVDFDPLYGLSGWLDLALTRAQRDALVSFANPSYKRIEIRYDKRQGERQLTALGMRQPLKQLSTIFLRELGSTRSS